MLPLPMICSETCRGRIIRREGEKNRGTRERGTQYIYILQMEYCPVYLS